MLQNTREAYNAYLAQLALINGTPDAGVSFSVAPTIAQKLIEHQQASSAFLSKISFETPVAQEGARVGVGVSRTIAGRVNTRGGTKRAPTPATDTTDDGGYRCEQTFYDSSIPWETLDAWAHKPEFQQLVRDAIIKRQALDRISIGFWGTSVAAATDRVANPRLQDVNKGWLHKLRTYAGSRVIDDGAYTSAGKAVYVSGGGTADYVNLDQLVYDAIELMDDWHQDSTDLVVMVGRGLVHDKYVKIIGEAGDTPTEQLARDQVLQTRQLGGLPTERVPDFPPTSLLITSYKNLAIYEQQNSRRRYVKDEPELTQIANYESCNEAFVVEDYGKCAFVENIVMGPKPA